MVVDIVWKPLLCIIMDFLCELGLWNLDIRYVMNSGIPRTDVFQKDRRVMWDRSPAVRLEGLCGMIRRLRHYERSVDRIKTEKDKYFVDV